MAKKRDPATRAAKLRERIGKRKARAQEPPANRGSDSQPRPGESPHAYVERRMRETLSQEKKKEVP